MTLKKKKLWYRTSRIQDSLFFFFRSKKIKKREYFRYQKYYEKYYGYQSKKTYKAFCFLILWRSFCAWLFLITLPLLIWCSVIESIQFYLEKHSLSIKDEIILEKELEELWKKEDEEEKRKSKLSTKENDYKI